MWGAGPPATWAVAIFLASDMLFLRLSPVVFGGGAFSQCVPIFFPAGTRLRREGGAAARPRGRSAPLSPGRGAPHWAKTHFFVDK